jgi:hypothetical protein
MSREITIIAAVFYLTYVIIKTHGPFNIFQRLRDKLPHGGLLTCPWCSAFWIALLVLLVPPGVVIDALAVAGIAMLVYGWSGWRYE